MKNWLNKNSIELSNLFLITSLIWFLVWGVGFRVYVDYPHLYSMPFKKYFLESFFVGFISMGLSLLFNFIYEFLIWLAARK